jgi:hypothetical protein
MTLFVVHRSQVSTLGKEQREILGGLDVRTRQIAEAIDQNTDIFLAVQNNSKEQNQLMRDLNEVAISQNRDEHLITRELIESLRVRYFSSFDQIHSHLTSFSRMSISPRRVRSCLPFTSRVGMSLLPEIKGL